MYSPLHSPALAHPYAAIAGFGFFCLFVHLAGRSLEKWRVITGHAPYQLGRRSTQEQRERFVREVPMSLRRQMRIFQGLGIASLLVGIVIASI